MGIAKLIKLTFKSNCPQSSESHLGLGLGPGSYLAASFYQLSLAGDPES